MAVEAPMLFTPLALRGVTLRNRIAMAKLTWSIAPELYDDGALIRLSRSAAMGQNAPPRPSYSPVCTTPVFGTTSAPGLAYARLRES
jgi:hypothetical protein